MRTTRNTRKDSHRARRAHEAHRAEQHGWSHEALPLRASLGERLAAKADEALSDAAASLRDGWLAVNETRRALG